MTTSTIPGRGERPLEHDPDRQSGNGNSRDPERGEPGHDRPGQGKSDRAPGQSDPPPT